MENDKDPEWLPFLKQQNAHTRAILDTLPRRDELLKRIQQLSGDIAAPAHMQKTATRLFYQQRPAGSNNFKLFVRENGKDRVLVDPTKLDTKDSHISLDWWQASPDGSKLAYGLSKDGSEDSVLHIMDVRSGAVLKERIADTQGASPSWLADSSGFFYNQLTGKVNTPERFLDSQVRFHKVGSDAGKDPILMKRGLDPAVQYENIQMPLIFASSHSATAILMLADVRQEKRIYTAPLKDVLARKAKWQLAADFADEVSEFDLTGDNLYLLSTRSHPRGRIVKTSAKAPSFAAATEVVPESTLVLQSMARQGRLVHPLHRWRPGTPATPEQRRQSHQHRPALRRHAGRHRRRSGCTGRTGDSVRLVAADRHLVRQCGWQTGRYRHHAQTGHRRQRLYHRAPLRDRQGRHADTVQCDLQKRPEAGW
jgi:prolyl oligopeptidase